MKKLFVIAVLVGATLGANARVAEGAEIESQVTKNLSLAADVNCQRNENAWKEIKVGIYDNKEIKVETAATVKARFEEVALSEQSDMAYNAEYDGETIKSMCVYQRFSNKKGDTSLKPFIQYQYNYGDDGLLLNRTVQYWCNGQWLTAAKYDYSLQDDNYIVEYSRKNVSNKGYYEPCGKMVYSILPDKSINCVFCYSRNHKKVPIHIIAKVELDTLLSSTNNYLTQNNL